MLRDIFGAWFDWPEFTLGLLLGAAAAWFVLRLVPTFNQVLEAARGVWERLQQGFTAGASDRFRGQLLVWAHTQHIARALFALEEIVVAPRLLAPRQPTDPQSTDPLPQELAGVLPTVADSSLLAGLYRAASIPLLEGLRSGRPFMITGDPGSGKSTALAYLAIQCSQPEEIAGPAFGLHPFLGHVADLRLAGRSYKDPLDPLVEALQRTGSSGVAGRLGSFLRQQLRQGRALLLIDGFDEVAQESIEPYAEWVAALIKAHPEARLVTTGPTRGYGSLARAGLVPVSIAPWGAHEQRAFLARWSEAWTQYVAPTLPKGRLGEVDPLMIAGWLISADRGLTPLEATLRAWSAFAGDVRGRTLIDGLEAYLSRFLSPEEWPQAEAVALNWLNQRLEAFSERTLPRGVPVSDLVDAGVLVRRPDGRLSFAHPTVGAYLGARALVAAGLTEPIARPGWAPAEAALTFYAAWGDMTQLVAQNLQDSGDPLARGVLTCARWLRFSPPRAAWRPVVLRAAATLAQDASRPYALRLAALETLVRAGESTVSVLFRRMLTSESPGSRTLAALGLGGLRDEASIEPLMALVNQDPDLRVRQAACLALVSLGSDAALESLGHVLLDGEESVRVAAAEALACHPDEGYNMLRDAVELDNLLTRRAALFGLSRVPEPWVLEILDRVQVDDKQWVVRGAAAEASERRRRPPWQVPPALDDLASLPWLVAYAAREGTGVAPGRAALEMLRRALNNGTPAEKIAALEALAWLEEGGELNLELFQALASPDEELRETAYDTLWRLSAAGVELRPPSRQAAR